MISVTDYIEDARKKLIDLTLRNRLINYRPGRSRSIRVIDENPREIYDILVLKGKAMRFLPDRTQPPSPQKKIPTTIPNITVTEEEITAESSMLWSDLHSEGPTPDRHKDLFLQTSFDKESLQKRLFGIHQESLSVLEEQGYTILYLALGFLEWYDSPTSQKPIKAPLILIPVDLKREEDRTTYRLEWTNEDIISNISLKEKLREQGINLPDFEMPDDKQGIDDYFKSTIEAVKKYMNWRVLSDIHLDFFSFTKFIMFKDLDSAAWPEGMGPANHPLISRICSPTESISQGIGFPDDEVDQRLLAQNVYHIMDADSSQIAVIEDIKAGKNLVVEGPPGTGKSQTIANAIAELMAQGKSVLFISEKMAALEVVKKRLDVAGLGDYCLALHSRKANKHEVLQDLQRTLNLSPPRQILLDDDLFQLEKTKSELNAYAAALVMPIGERKISPFTLFGTSETVRKHFAQVARPMPRIVFPNPECCTEWQWAEAKQFLATIVEVLPRVRPVNQNAWYGTSPGLVLPAHVDQIQGLLNQCQNALVDLTKNITYLTDMSGVTQPLCIRDLQDAINATKLITSSNPIDRDLLINKAWDAPHPAVAPLTTKLRSYKTKKAEILKKFNPRIFDEDVEALIGEYQPRSAKFFLFRLFDSQYRTLRQQILLFYKSSENRSDEIILRDLISVLDCFKTREEILYDGTIGKSLFGSLWDSEDSNPDELEHFSRWIVEFRYQILHKVFTERTVDMVSRGASSDEIRDQAQKTHASLDCFLQTYAVLSQRLAFDIQKQSGLITDDIPFTEFERIIGLWNRAMPTLVHWSHYSNGLKNLNNSVGKIMLSVIEQENLPESDVIPAFEGCFADALLERAFMDRSALANFIGDSHDKLIERFIELDKKIIFGNRLRLMAILWQNMPKMIDGASKSSDMGILQSEFVKKRKHMPIRVLMKNAGGLIQKIKPCFMMSPLSVAQFLDPQTVKFDVIIFDEASQVRPEDALGSLLRSNQAVVIGDSKQLPPTSFFDKIIAADPDANEETTALPSDIESILNFCKMGFPTKMLRWHYRSRHESLITLSNSRFYNNSLYVYPSPMKNIPQLGLKFVYNPNNVYDRGVSSINRGEAREVANAVIDHFKHYPDKSLGVGTFNIKQQQAIFEELEVLLQDNPDIQHLFRNERGEDFFVKNLETIQGDERDVIFLSVGFGKDANGKLSQNFGPLNQEGGERRLNVLITRARERCVVFSNFTAKDLNISETSPFGLKILKLFLEYAETGVPPVIMMPGEDLESPFEESVYEFLRSRGHHIQKQVGCVGFRIDLAIVDPRAPGRYLIGIECDGAQYHSSKVARDRDRLRQQILEGLGWTIYRVWSTDWYRSPVSTKQALLDAIESARNNPLSPGNHTAHTHEGTTSFKEIQHRVIPTIPNNISSEPMEFDIPDYNYCQNLSVGICSDVISSDTQTLVQAVFDVVEIESPIHIDDVITRIHSLAGISRMGQKMKAHLMSAISYAVLSNNIIRDEDFLLKKNNDQKSLRRRSPEQKPDIDRIYHSEIESAVFMVLKNQFATSREDLVIPVARIFGMKSTRKVSERILSIVDSMVYRGSLEVLPNRKISIMKNSVNHKNN